MLDEGVKSNCAWWEGEGLGDWTSRVSYSASRWYEGYAWGRAESSGQGEGGLDSAGGAESRAFWANVVWRVPSSESCCTGLEAIGADVVGGERGVVVEEKGLKCGVVEVVENGFVPALPEDEGGFEPKMALPRFRCTGFEGASSFFFFFLLPPLAVLDTLTALIPLILPSFRRQDFVLHANMYSRRSWPGKRSGRSPFSCSNRVIMLPQTLHLARWALGRPSGSSHVYGVVSSLRVALIFFGLLGSPAGPQSY